MNEKRNKYSSNRNILFISALDFWSMGNGKGGPALWKTLNGYAEHGWKVHFITGNKISLDSDDLNKNIKVYRFDAKWLKYFFKIKKIGFFAKAIWWFWFQLNSFYIALNANRKEKINIAYGYEIYGVPIAKILSLIWRVPVVSRFQGTTLGVSWMKKKFWKVRAWDHWVAYKIPVNLVIMTNDGTQGDEVLSKVGVSKNKIKFWMNGVNWEIYNKLISNKFAKNQLTIKSNYLLLTLSRLVSWKCVDRSIKIMPDLIKDNPDVELLIIGDGPEKKKLEELANKLGVVKYIRFEGGISHEEVPKYLAAADIFLSFYDWSNVGNPLLEAMMAGKCIVTLNNGDTGRFVQNDQNGLLLEYEDLPKVPEIISELLEDEKRREYLGNNARKYAEQNFWSWEERIEAEINEVVSLLK
jgi:glycosyltransferase involved in cell wall biosynthesis